MGFSRKRTLEWVTMSSCPPPRDLPNPGVKPRSPTLQVDSLPAEPQGKPKNTGVGSLFLLQWIAYSFSTGSSCPRNWTRVSWIAGGFFTNWASREAPACLLHDPTNVGNVLSGSSASSKPSLYIWKFSVHENFQRCLKPHYITECQKIWLINM